MQKKEFTSFDVTAAVRELKPLVTDSRVNNVYQLDGKTLLLKLHKTDGPSNLLVIGAGRRIHLTSYVLEKPLVPPAFCMALRKYLRNARLSGIDQHEFERVVTLSFTSQAGSLRLVLELFGDGNIILVSEDGKILQALTYKRMRDRNILRNEAFMFAPSSGKNPFKVAMEEFSVALEQSGDVEVVRVLARFFGLGGIYAEETLLRASVDKAKPCRLLSFEERHTIFRCLQELLSQARDGKLEPCIVLDEIGGFVDVMPLRLKRYERSGVKFQEFGSFNEALDEFYAKTMAAEKAISEINIEKLRREEERLRRVIADQEAILKENQTLAEQNRRFGDLIYAHFGELQLLVDKFKTGKQNGREWKTIVSEIMNERQSGATPWSYFESFDSKSLMICVNLDGVSFGLVLRKSLYERAAEFYERAKKAKQKVEGAGKALDDSRRKLELIGEEIRAAAQLERVGSAAVSEELAKRKVKHKEWFEKFRWFISSDGFLVVAGRDAVSNEVLIKKYTEDADVVFHADIVGAPFVVVKTHGKTPSEECLREAGVFAASFSRGWREGFASVDVYWVKPEQLSKGGPSGESVGRGAFVVRGERKWMRGTQLKTAVGITLQENGEIRFVGGPVEAVKSKARAFLTIVPGDDVGKEFFKQILKTLANKSQKEMKERILKASPEEIRDFIPYGKGRIMAEH